MCLFISQAKCHIFKNPLLTDFYWLLQIYQRDFIDLLWYFVTTTTDDKLFMTKRKKVKAKQRKQYFLFVIIKTVVH